jgi:hypothetical protein
MARKSWLDDEGQTTVIDDYAQKLTTFMNAMADGKIDGGGVTAHEKRLVDLMKKVEPKLDDKLHAEVTELLCELSAFNVMQLLHDLGQQRPKTKFRG